MSSPLPLYNIYAVKYAGPLKSSMAMVLWNTDWEKMIERNYYLWVIQGERETLLVDCGVAPSLAEERKISGYVNPVDVLRSLLFPGHDLKMWTDYPRVAEDITCLV